MGVARLARARRRPVRMARRTRVIAAAALAARRYGGALPAHCRLNPPTLAATRAGPLARGRGGANALMPGDTPI